MLVHSFAFLFLFLPATAFVYFLLQPKPDGGSNLAARLWLVAVSLFFYALSGVQHLPVLLGSILGNRLLARAIHAAPAGSRQRRLLLIAGLCANISLLGFFKYADMFLPTFGAAGQALWGGAAPELLRLALPLGLSFFTLQQIAYLMDVYEGLAEPLTTLDHLLFTGFFAQVMAGPIARVRQLMPQFHDPERWRFSWDNAARGLYVLALGLFKKAVLADTLARFAAAGFDQANQLSLAEAWTASLAFTLQLYFDFSGYVDVVTGAALLFNIQLAKNFDSPLAALSLIDFWRRWHITLSNFITTYIYTPLVRAWTPISFPKSLLAILVTMAIAGLWHGAAWTFVAFGLVHGLGLCATHLWRKRKTRLPAALAWLLTFFTVNAGFVFFRAHDFAAAFRVFSGMAGQNGLVPAGVAFWRVLLLDPLAFDRVPLFDGMGYLDTVLGLGFLVLGLAGALLLPNSGRLMEQFQPTRRAALTLAAWLFASLVFMNSFLEKGFVYRDF